MSPEIIGTPSRSGARSRGLTLQQPRIRGELRRERPPRSDLRSVADQGVEPRRERQDQEAGRGANDDSLDVDSQHPRLICHVETLPRVTQPGGEARLIGPTTRWGRLVRVTTHPLTTRTCEGWGDKHHEKCGTSDLRALRSLSETRLHRPSQPAFADGGSGSRFRTCTCTRTRTMPVPLHNPESSQCMPSARHMRLGLRSCL